MTTRNHYRIRVVDRDEDRITLRLLINPEHADHGSLFCRLSPLEFDALCLDLGLRPTDASGAEYASGERPLHDLRAEEE